MTRDSELDIVIYGATGYTGRLVAEYLLQRYGNTETVRWAMAGRDLDKLREVRDEIGAPAGIPLVLADAGDAASLRAMVERTQVVLSTVGPYQLYGSRLVACCVDAGCDYVDLCGEPAWMRQMIDLHQENARNNGAHIVFSCGFDSVPFDLGVYFLQKASLSQYEEPLSRVKGRVRRMKGGFSGGTIASLRAARAEADKNPFLLTPGFQGPTQPDGALPVYDDELQSWAAPFVMADINTRNVHRSNTLLGHLYGSNFIYDEMLLTGPGEKGEAVARAIAGRELLPPEEASPQPGEGPSVEEREAGSFDLIFSGTTQDGSIIQACVTGDQDPGYGSTAKMITESALCLIDESATIPGGLWTPAAAMGEKLIDRLSKNAGLTFVLD